MHCRVRSIALHRINKHTDSDPNKPLQGSIKQCTEAFSQSGTTASKT